MMEFDYIEWMMSQLLLMILVVAAGLLLGRLKLGKFSFGASGTLFVGLFVGWWVYDKAGAILAVYRAGAFGHLCGGLCHLWHDSIQQPQQSV